MQINSISFKQRSEIWHNYSRALVLSYLFDHDTLFEVSSEDSIGKQHYFTAHLSPRDADYYTSFFVFFVTNDSIKAYMKNYKNFINKLNVKQYQSYYKACDNYEKQLLDQIVRPNEK